MRMVWLLAVVFAVVAGIALPGIAEYAYPHVFHGAGAIPVYKEDLTDLPAWVAFYRRFNIDVVPLQFNFVVVPLVTVGIGVGVFLFSRLSFTWLPLGTPRSLKDIGLKPLKAARRNSVATIAVIAIVLSVINLGVLTWQIWPEGSYTPPPRYGYSAPTGDFRDVTERRIRQLERELSDVRGLGGFGLGRSIPELSREIDGLRDCINGLTSGGYAFGC